MNHFCTQYNNILYYDINYRIVMDQSQFYMYGYYHGPRVDPRFIYTISIEKRTWFTFLTVHFPEVHYYYYCDYTIRI